ncbi:hypothetical protein ACOTVJ_10700 [Aliarcobacter butzleri]
MLEKLREVANFLTSGEGLVVLFLAIIGIVSGVITYMLNKNEKNIQKNGLTQNSESNESINATEKFDESKKRKKEKSSLKILFIDDDIKFKVINIIKNSGWINTKIVKDISNLDSDEVKNTDIFFVDIQGVGIKLKFTDEGLGLANAIKSKYPEKKVVIYSAETRGDRFHEALRKADDFLAKNAEPFEFQQTIERLSK